MAYSKQSWFNGNAGGTPVSADRLNHIEDGIKAVHDLDALKAPLASPTLTGTVTVPTPAVGDDTSLAASTAFVQDAIREPDSYTWWRRQYQPASWYFANSPTSWVENDQPVTDRLRLTPFVVTTPVDLAEFAAEFTTAGDAGSILRLGLYAAAADDTPGALIAELGSISLGTGDAGTVATAGTPGVYTLTIGISLNPGLHWIGGVVQGASNVYPTVVDTNPAQIMHRVHMETVPSVKMRQCAAAVPGVSGVLPANINTPEWSPSAPRVAYRTI